MTETKLRESVLAWMLRWLGSTRGDKYHKEILAAYNSITPLPRGYKMTVADHYCAATASAAYIKAGLAGISVVECGAGKMIELAKKKGIWVENDAHTPKPADIVIYDWQDTGKGDNKGVPDHVGIVETVSAGAMTILEGNRPLGKVARHPLAVNGRYIRGYICPDFKSIATPEKTITQIAKEVIAGKWGNGATRKRRLTEAGYDYAAVQAEVNRLLAEQQQSYTVYVVVSGDTLGKIAKKYGTTVKKLAKDNGITNVNLIHVGQKLKIYR